MALVRGAGISGRPLNSQPTPLKDTTALRQFWVILLNHRGGEKFKFQFLSPLSNNADITMVKRAQNSDYLLSLNPLQSQKIRVNYKV